MALTGQSLGNQQYASNQATQADIYSGALTARPPSGLSAAVNSLSVERKRAMDSLARLGRLGDAIGGAVPMGAADAKGAPAPQGHLGELMEVTNHISALMTGIEEEIARLEGLAG